MARTPLGSLSLNQVAAVRNPYESQLNVSSSDHALGSKSWGVAAWHLCQCLRRVPQVSIYVH